MRNCIRLSWIGLAVVLFGLLSVGTTLLVGIATEEDEEETSVTERFLSMFSTDDEAA